jgi:hypothetical protein
MPRPSITLEPYKDQIKALRDDGITLPGICGILQEEHGCTVELSTLKRRLKRWGYLKQIRLIETPELHLLIVYLFKDIGLPDADIVRVLSDKGFNVNTRKLQEIRKRLGLRRRLLAEELDDAIAEVRQLLLQEVHGNGEFGTARSFGTGHMHTHLNTRGIEGAGDIKISHAIIREAFRVVDPEGVIRRWHELKAARGEFIVPGPNFVWSIDGYCKLRFMGIEIYAGIDGYSRFVPWHYCGISNDTAVSSLVQFLNVVEEEDTLPLHIRSDRGPETPMVADAQYLLHQAAAIRDNREPYEFSDIYWFGTSTANQRIEAWWGQLAKGSLNKWKIYFQDLRRRRLFSRKSLPDMIAMLCIYMPIIRHAVDRFVHLWNRHQIRPQANRSYAVPGRPWMNYHHPPKDIRDYGVRPDAQKVAEMQELYSDWDIDAFLPQVTLNWCHVALQETGYQLPINHTDMIDGTPKHTLAYIDLRAELFAHINSGEEPHLGLLVKPINSYDW